MDHGPSSDEVVLPKWRYQYVDGSLFSRPCTIISFASFAFLAYKGAEGGPRVVCYVTLTNNPSPSCVVAADAVRRRRPAQRMWCPVRPRGPAEDEWRALYPI